MRRKAILLGIWLMVPVLVLLSPGLFGLLEPGVGFRGMIHTVGLVWLGLAVAGVLFRTLQLIHQRGWVWGAAWATKILTDPFHNIAIYWRSPGHLLRGQMLDPIGNPH